MMLEQPGIGGIHMSGSDAPYRMWNEAQCKMVMDAVYRLLEQTGCAVKNGAAVKLMLAAGCQMDGDMVKIPRAVLERAIETAPSQIQIYDRDGAPAMDLRNGNVYYGPAITTVFTLDPETGQKRNGTRKDAENVALVCEAMPNIDYVCALGGIFDGDVNLSDLYEIQALVKNTRKPIWYWSAGPAHMELEFEMLEAVAGGEQALRDKPFAIALCCPMDPLMHSEDVVEQLLYLAGKKAPVVYIAGIGMGGSGPIFIAGDVVEGVADTLVGLLISQLANPGTPFIVSKYSDNLSMRTLTPCHSRPEAVAADVATADVFRYLDLPFALNFGDTDSGTFDENMTQDMTAQIYAAQLSGTVLAQSIGGMESGASSSILALVAANDIIGYVRKAAQVSAVTEETLCVDAITRVGPGGAFTMEEDTLMNFRDFWAPESFVPRSYDERAKANMRPMASVMADRVRQIVEAGSQCPLPDEVAKEIDGIIEQA